LIATVLTAAVLLPVIFKEDIKLAIDEQLEASVNADILFDVDNFSLSMFSNFPNITASMKEFGVINRAPFEGEILFAAEALEIEINLKSILFDDTPRLKGLSLIGPIINIKVLEDGRANYDIAVPSEEEAPVAEEESGDFSFGIDHWEIVNGEIVYDDKSLPFLLELKGFDHSGSGDFTQDVFDLKTLTHADTINMGYDGDMYFSDKSFDMDITITLSDDMSKYTFKENTLTINDFSLGFDGWLFMGPDYYDMDLTYAAKDNTFKSLLSIIPGMYTADFADIEAAGVLSFEGGARGKYDSLSMPAFNVGLLVKDGMFKYPDLPTAVENINLDMKVDNADGVIENTKIDIATFHMDFGKNPVDARLSVANLRDYLTDATIKASLNLAELGQMFPIEGLDMKGIYTLDMTAKGTYDSTMKTMPVLQGTMALDKGYIKSSEFPIPLEDLHFNTTLENKTGKMSDFTAHIKDFTMIMDKEEFRADVLFRNLDNYTWDVKAKGGVDIEKMTHIFPLEGMELAGKIKADIQTSGDMAALDAEQYEKLPTSGSMALDGFTYKDVTLPYDVTIKTATATFDPRKMTLENYEGTVGKSDMKMKGNITNYMGYVLHDNEVLRGTLDFQSNLLDMNELMAEEEEEGQSAPAEEDTAAYTVVPIPKNIDFVLNSTIKRMVFMDLNIDNAKGNIIVRDGVANLSDITFNLLGGTFKMAGAYDTKDPDKPLYDFNLDIENLPIKEAFSYFTIVKKFAPIAQSMDGNFST
ncbi:MAG: membrane biogenesis protein, partial [Cyclobacteriaceae bacterium]|nr:membrane biogenesis protein [Cyclobacteriaceae bacterium]